MAEVIDIVEAFKDAKRRNPHRPYELPLGMPERFRPILDAMDHIDNDDDVLIFCRDVIFPRIKTIFAERGEKLIIRTVPIRA
jgi:hypothetical protein